jgi:hypothetical protein
MAKYFLDSLHGQPAPDKTKEPLVLEYVHGSNFERAVQAIPGLAAHITDRLTVVGWSPDLQRGLDAAFAKLSSPDARLHIPTAEANFDLDRFLAKYFLDGLNGKPAPRKTLEPIELYQFFKHGARLQAAVASIPGLQLCCADGVWGTNTIIGWDVDKVKLRKRKIEEEKAKEKAKKAAAALAAREDEWQRALRPHHEYMKNHQVPTSPLKLDHLPGSYVVRLEKMENYCSDGKVMTLDIAQPCNAHGTMAAFDFGLVEGTMLLALSGDALHLLMQDLEVCSDEEVGQDYASSGKRTAQGPHRAQGPIKRRLGETPKSNRVYLQWAGRDPGTGEIQLDTANEHTGYLDFDASKASAEGVLAYPSFFGDERLAFMIRKVADRPSKIPESWSRFNKKRYDYESRARWGGW